MKFKQSAIRFWLPAMVLLAGLGFSAFAADPTSTAYPAIDCEGSLTPYRVPASQVAVPDSLTAVFINHVGRHGARYPAGASNTLRLIALLEKADSLGTITPLGKKLKSIAEYVAEVSHNRWGALDSVGMAEQRGIAARMYLNFPKLFGKGAVVNAISSYSPRAMMSMFCFVHELDRYNSNIFVLTSTGRQNSALMRPFDINEEYLDWRKTDAWVKPYQEHLMKTAPLAPLKRVLGAKFPMEESIEWKDNALLEYYLLAGMSAMGTEVNALEFFTLEEYNALWSCFNLRQYLVRCSSTLSSAPADIAGPLVEDLIKSTEDFIAGTSTDVAQLRFGHAETLMPLLSLMRVPGCYYMTNYFDTVALHWRDFYVVPMASNLQMILFRSNTGKYYVRTDLNEVPVQLIPGKTDIYIPWKEVKNYLERCLPIELL